MTYAVNSAPFTFCFMPGPALFGMGLTFNRSYRRRLKWQGGFGAESETASTRRASTVKLKHWRWGFQRNRPEGAGQLWSSQLQSIDHSLGHGINIVKCEDFCISSLLCSRWIQEPTLASASVECIPEIFQDLGQINVLGWWRADIGRLWRLCKSHHRRKVYVHWPWRHRHLHTDRPGLQDIPISRIAMMSTVTVACEDDMFSNIAGESSYENKPTLELVKYSSNDILLMCAPWLWSGSSRPLSSLGCCYKPSLWLRRFYGILPAILQDEWWCPGRDNGTLTWDLKGSHNFVVNWLESNAR
jgi:hypothetical protein